MTDESVKARLERGDWVTLDEAFPELVPSDLKEEIKAAIAEAVPYDGVTVIERQVRDARTAEWARKYGSNEPSPVRSWDYGAYPRSEVSAIIRQVHSNRQAELAGRSGSNASSTVDAAKRSAIVEHFRKALSAINVAVRKLLASKEWQVERIMPDGSVQSIVPLAWHNMRFRWDGEREFTGQFPGALVCLPDASGRRVGCKLPLTMFQVRRASAPNAAPPTVCTTQNSPEPDAETSETPQETAPPTFKVSDDKLIELALNEDRQRHDAGEELLTLKTRQDFMRKHKSTMTANYYKTIFMPKLREKAKERGVTLRGRGASPKKE